MDLTTAPTTTTDTENEPPPPIAQPSKSFSLTNGALRKHSHHPPPAVVVNYKECLKNHAARLGGHAVDGCGEFMPTPAANSADPSSLKCAACGCHRNFHRREEDPTATTTTTTTTTCFLDFQRHPPLPRLAIQSSPSPSSSPPPQPSYYSSAPHMLLALSSAVAEAKPTTTTKYHPGATPTAAKENGRKRFRTKFSQDQKEKMLSFSEKVGWKIQKSDEGLVEEFCNEVGVGKGVLKIWMHNNKHTFSKRSDITTGTAAAKASHRNGRFLSFDSNGHHNSPTTTAASSRHESEDNNGFLLLPVSTSGSPSSA